MRRHKIQITVPMVIDFDRFQEQKGYILSRYIDNPEHKDVAGILNILDAITDEIYKVMPELEPQDIQ